MEEVENTLPGFIPRYLLPKCNIKSFYPYRDTCKLLRSGVFYLVQPSLNKSEGFKEHKLCYMSPVAH